MELRLEKKNNKKSQTEKMKQFGLLEDIITDDEIDNLKMTKIEFPNNNNDDGYKIPMNEIQNNSKTNVNNTIIHMNLLYGSNKPYGILPSKPHKQRFSHKRVFDSKFGVAKSKVKSAKRASTQ